MRSGCELAGRYRLESPLGKGGMGEVWRAVDLRLRRPVAVKILPLTVAADRVAVTRFRREAEIAATLNHPGITTVFDVDEHHDGDQHLLFLVMELMQGRDLAAVLAEYPHGLPIAQVMNLAGQLLEALSVAHANGVVHRDIKPANLFLVTGGRAKICDFGIARLVNSAQATATWGAAGTPLYMAPEQIQGRQVDHRTDLYAFGCVLYELLVGTTWIDTGSDVGAILYQHMDRSPVPPQTLRADVPAHLNALVVDLLAKQSDHRPQSAATVAERLYRLPSGPATPRPPVPRPGGPSPAGLRPAAAGPATTPVRNHSRRRVVLLGGLGAAAALVGSPAAVLLSEPGHRLLALTGTSVVTIDNYLNFVTSLALSPDGKTLVAGSGDNNVALWAVPSGDPDDVFRGGADGVTSVAFSPDGRIVATGTEQQTAQLWDVGTSVLMATLTGHTDILQSVAFSPDSKTIVTGSRDGTARLWDVAGKRTVATLTGHTDAVEAVAFSPDGKTIATGSDDKTVRLWERGGGSSIATLNGHTDHVYAVAFSPDGRTLAAGGQDATTRLWHVTGGHIATLTGSGVVTSVAFRPDGKVLATSDDDKVRLWDVAARRTVATLVGHTSGVTSVAFTPDGRILASGSEDQTIRLWKISG